MTPSNAANAISVACSYYKVKFAVPFYCAPRKGHRSSSQEMWQLCRGSCSGACPFGAGHCRASAWATKGKFGGSVTLWAVKGQVWQSPVVKGSQGLIEPAKSHRRDGWPQRCSLWQESQTISYFSCGRWCKLFFYKSEIYQCHLS